MAASRTAAGAEPETEPEGSDPALAQLMLTEVRGHLSDLEAFVTGLAEGAIPVVTSDLVRAVHTLAGNFSMAPLGQEAAHRPLLNAACLQRCPKSVLHAAFGHRPLGTG